MPTLHVRNVPERLYGRIRSLAQARKRSLSAEVIMLLDQAVESRELRAQRAGALAEIDRLRFQPSEELPPAEALIREDRDR